jgi:hypothetical protein
MKLRFAFGAFLFILIAIDANGQNMEYYRLVAEGERLFDAREYKESAASYSRSFALAGRKAVADDRFNAARAWAEAGNKDSALQQLEYLATKLMFANYKLLLDDTDLKSLHTDKRWVSVCGKVKKNREHVEVKFNKPLVARLDTILYYDQKYRLALDTATEEQMKAIWDGMRLHDSLNELEVIAILDKYGWPSVESVGEMGAEPIFLVIQHAHLKTQDKYLPVMRDAVKKGNAKAAWMALLEDRVALRHGRMQIYGSQVSGDEHGGYVAPMIDPDHVDERRASVGLGPLAAYLRYFELTWDVADYKKQLPDIEKREAAGH